MTSRPLTTINDVSALYIVAAALINSECDRADRKRSHGSIVAAGMGGDPDIEEPAIPADLRKRAMRYRRMAASISDPQTLEALLSLAAEYETMAERLEELLRAEGG
jgi:hypothetical protein